MRPVLHTWASESGTQMSLLPVSSWSVKFWPGVPNLQVEKYPPLACSFVMTSSKVSARFPSLENSSCRCVRWISHWTTPFPKDAYADLASRAPTAAALYPFMIVKLDRFAAGSPSWSD